MTKEDFTRRIAEQFNGIASAAKRQAEAEIEEADQRLIFEPFCAWLERRRARALRYPFSSVLKAAHTPGRAAREFANFIAFDAETGAEIDWTEHWEQAAPILANWQPEKSDGWKYGHYLRNYIAAVRGYACASAFDRRISDGIELNKKSLRDDIAGGKGYQSTWRYWKGLLKEPSLTEARFLEAEIAETERRIKEQESGAAKGDQELTRLHREKLRVFKKRLEALEQGTTKNAPGNKPAVSQPLPTLEEVVKDAGKFLPKLWAALAKEKPPAFGIEGNFILERERGEHAALYALAAALCADSRLLKGTKPITVYRILCARFEREPTPRADKIPRGKRDYSSFYDRFLDVVRGC